MKYARKCTKTGKGMNEGWIDEDTDEYFKYKADAVIHIKEIMSEEFPMGWENIDDKSDDDILDIGYNHYGVYYTEWDDSDAEYEEIEGEMYRIFGYGTNY